MAQVFTIPVTQSDEELIAAFRQTGRQEALATLYLRYSDLLYGTCLKYLKDADDAKDAVMSIYQELLKKLPLHEVVHFKSWVYVVAKNYCLMQLRAAKKNITVRFDNQGVHSDDFLHLEEVLEKEAALKHLEKCMQTLTQEQQQSIELFYHQKKCYNEIVACTGMDWNSVRSSIQNGRRNLKICMEKNVG